MSVRTRKNRSRTYVSNAKYGPLSHDKGCTLTSTSEAEVTDLAALSDDALAEHLADLNRQWLPLRKVQVAPLNAGRSVNPMPWVRKCELGILISEAEVETARRRLATAEAEFASVREAIDSQHDEASIEEAKAGVAAAKEALRQAEVTQRRVTYATAERRNRLSHAQAAVHQAAYDVDRWQQERVREQQRLEAAVQRAVALGYSVEQEQS